MPLFGGKPNIEKIKAKRNIKRLIKALSYPKDREVRRGAAFALGDLGDTRAIEPLIAALKDEEVRTPAALALEKLGWELTENEAGITYCIATRNWEKCAQIGGLEPLVDRLKNDAYFVVRSEVAAALGRIKDSRAVEPLITALKNDQVAEVRTVAAASLEGFVSSRVTESLCDALTDIDTRVRVASAQVLGKRLDVTAVEPLINALGDFSGKVRRSAAEALKVLYHSNKLEATMRSAIFDKSSLMAKYHEDFTSLHRDVGHSDNGHADRDCGMGYGHEDSGPHTDHEDYDGGHTDTGIGTIL